MKYQFDQIASWLNAKWGNGKFMKLAHEIANWFNDKLMKWHEITIWWNEKLIKLAYEIASWWNHNLMLWQVDKISYWNGILIK